MGIRLVDLRTRAMLSRAKAARRAGLNPSTIYLLETGRSRPTAETLLRLADLYGGDPRAIILPAYRGRKVAGHE